MFNKWFGKTQKIQQNNPIVDNQARYEKTMYGIIQQRNKMEDELDRLDTKTLTLDLEIRNLVSQKKGPQAKSKIQELKSYQKQIEGLQTKYNVMTQMMMQLESLWSDREIAETLNEAVNLAKEQIVVNEQLSDALLDWNDFRVSQAETDDIWKQMSKIGVDEDDLTAEFNKYEVQQEQLEVQQLRNAFDKVPVTEQVAIEQQQSLQPQIEALLE